MDTATTAFSGLSHARLTAYAAVLLLCGFVGWQATRPPATVVVDNSTEAQLEDAASTDYLAALASNVASQVPEGITPLGTTILAQSIVAYEEGFLSASTSGAGLSAVQAFGESVRPNVVYRTYAASDVKTSPEITRERVLAYRADLRVALEPLLENKEYELDIFAMYVDTSDPKHLAALKAAAGNYRFAIANTENVVAPADAAIYQAAILTAMSKFAAMLDALAENATDPFASAALMRTFIDAQDTMLASFDSIAKYSQQKLL